MPASPSPAQSSASRANGARSRGPATPDGKARSAANAPTRHGLRGGAFRLLPHEDAAEFERLRRDLRVRQSPRGEAEEHWCDELARACWRQRRLFALEDAAMTAPLAPPAEGDGPDRLPSLATLARYRARIERDVRLAREQLDAARAERPRLPSALGRARAARLRWLADRMDEAAAAAGTGDPEAPAGTLPTAAEGSAPEAVADGTGDPEPVAADPARPLNRAQRRRLAALRRRQGA